MSQSSLQFSHATFIAGLQSLSVSSWLVFLNDVYSSEETNLSLVNSQWETLAALHARMRNISALGSSGRFALEITACECEIMTSNFTFSAESCFLCLSCNAISIYISRIAFYGFSGNSLLQVKSFKFHAWHTFVLATAAHMIACEAAEKTKGLEGHYRGQLKKLLWQCFNAIFFDPNSKIWLRIESSWSFSSKTHNFAFLLDPREPLKTSCKCWSWCGSSETFSF